MNAAKDNMGKEEEMKNAKVSTKKGLESAVMGNLSNVSSMKLSDFIDESFLEDLEDELQKDQQNSKGAEKKSLKDFMKILCEASSTRLPFSASYQNI
jgi:hypothetical protein